LVTFVLITAGTLFFSAYLMTTGAPGGLVQLLATVFAAMDGVLAMVGLALVLGAALTSLAAVYKRDGSLANVQRQSGQVPGLLAGARAAAGTRGLAWLAGAAGVMLVILTILCSRLTALVLAGWIYLVLGAGSRSLPFLALWLAWQDMARVRPKLLHLPPDPSQVFLAVAGLAAGATLALVMPGQPWVGLLAGAALVALSLVICLGSGVRLSLPGRRGQSGGDAR
jgi:hypothetical protein